MTDCSILDERQSTASYINFGEETIQFLELGMSIDTATLLCSSNI